MLGGVIDIASRKQTRYYTVTIGFKYGDRGGGSSGAHEDSPENFLLAIPSDTLKVLCIENI